MLASGSVTGRRSRVVCARERWAGSARRGRTAAARGPFWPERSAGDTRSARAGERGGECATVLNVRTGECEPLRRVLLELGTLLEGAIAGKGLC